MLRKGLGLMVGALLLAGCAGGPGKRSTGQVIDDSAIHTKATAALLNDPVTRKSKIDVDVHKGIVVLNGAVESEPAKQKAEDTIRGIEGVKAIENKLVVRQ